MKSYQVNYEQMETTNQITVTGSEDKGALYSVKKCAEIVLRQEEAIEYEGLMMLIKKVEALYPNNGQFYTLLCTEK